MHDFTNPPSREVGGANPFSEDVFVDRPDRLPGVVRIHHGSFDRIAEAVESLATSPEQGTTTPLVGRTLLLSAPRAGYGKSHLAARVRDRLRSTALAVSLPLDPARPVDWATTLTAIVRQFCRQPATRSGSDSLFEETGRYFLSRLVLGYLAGGGAEDDDCPEEESRIRSEFAKLFSPESESGLLHWTDRRSHELGRGSDPDFLRRLDLAPDQLGFWTRLLIDWNLRGEPALESFDGLSEGEARDRLLQWLRIASIRQPVLVLADDLDGFFGSETAGMEIAAILAGIRESVPRSVTLLCLNDDVWHSIFRDHLPSAWLDRLAGETEVLRPLAPAAAADLAVDRLVRQGLAEAAARRFADRLSVEGRWVETGSDLFPRTVLRQARDLWEREGASPSDDVAGEDHAGQEENGVEGDAAVEDEERPPSGGGEEAGFFVALEDDQPLAATEPTDRPHSSQEMSSKGEPGASGEERVEQSPPENPFFVTPPRADAGQLAGIDSIIRDIRGSGKTVASESPPSEEAPRAEEAASEPTPEKAESTAPPSPEPAPFRAGELTVQPARNGAEKSPPAAGFDPPRGGSSAVGSDTDAEAPTPAQLESRLRRRESELLFGSALRLDLERLAGFVRTVGARHGGFVQTEERYPGSRSVCLHWKVRARSVLVGFESPRNVYFWNNLLQQSLASNRKEKITAFSHASDPFDPALFSGFGFSPAVIKGRIDIIEMNDRELAMLYAAESVLAESRDGPGYDAAMQLVTRHLDPLWRRISQPV